MIFNDKLSLVLESISIDAKLTKLYDLIGRIATDFGTKLNIGKGEQFDDENIGRSSATINDQEGTIAWLTIDYDLARGWIREYTILAAPAEGQEWDFVDITPETTYDEFLGWTADVPVEPPSKDYGIAILNMIAWVINAHQQIAVNGSQDLDNLYEAGAYRVEITLEMPDGEQATTRYWVQATSSEDARQQLIDRLGDSLIGQPRVVQFAEASPDWE